MATNRKPATTTTKPELQTGEMLVPSTDGKPATKPATKRTPLHSSAACNAYQEQLRATAAQWGCSVPNLRVKLGSACTCKGWRGQAYSAMASILRASNDESATLGALVGTPVAGGPAVTLANLAGFYLPNGFLTVVQPAS